jgi:serine/threonine-protein kinase
LQLAGVKLNERFEIRGFLGKGATARVYLARDGKDGKPVAVKVLEPEFAKDKKMRERFKREAEAVNAVGHPAIPYLLAMDEHDGAPYIVMEYLFGESLGDLLNRGGALTLGTALLAMRRCAGALAATHQKGIVHRDIKPDNIFLIGEKGNPYEAKVVDFGFARLRSSSLTAAGIVLGTVNYMAPEQVVNDPLDSSTDVYALGMVMYRVFTGRSPYDAKCHHRGHRSSRRRFKATWSG